MGVLKFGFLLTALTALFVMIGNWLGGPSGAMIALTVAVALNFGAFWFSDSMVLKMTKARPMDVRAYPWLAQANEQLATRAGIPTPRLFLVPDPQPNAFATGRNPKVGVVAINQGLLDLMEPREVVGVLAHEIGHIKHRDTLTMTVVATLAGAIMMLAGIVRFTAIFGGHDEERSPLVALGIAIIAPLAAMMIQMGISRAREYEADKTAAMLTGEPEGLASALGKLDAATQAIPSNMPASAAHLCISNPLRGAGGLMSLFSTHPPTQQRIARLRALKV